MTNKLKSILISKRISYNNLYQIRPMISFLKQQNKQNLIGAEIGVAAGLNAKSILSNLDIKKLSLIDTFSCNDWHYSHTKRNLSAFKNKVILIKKLSHDAYKDINEKLDFIYIDGDHTYEAVKQDIENYFPLIKKGGVMGGHDFWAHDLGVVKAVLEFTKKHNLKLNGQLTDWWFEK